MKVFPWKILNTTIEYLSMQEQELTVSLRRTSLETKLERSFLASAAVKLRFQLIRLVYVRRAHARTFCSSLSIPCFFLPKHRPYNFILGGRCLFQILVVSWGHIHQLLICVPAVLFLHSPKQETKNSPNP